MVQRDEAKHERDEAKKERDEAKDERDHAKAKVSDLESEIEKLKARIAELVSSSPSHESHSTRKPTNALRPHLLLKRRNPSLLQVPLIKMIVHKQLVHRLKSFRLGRPIHVQ